MVPEGSASSWPCAEGCQGLYIAVQAAFCEQLSATLQQYCSSAQLVPSELGDPSNEVAL